MERLKMLFKELKVKILRGGGIGVKNCFFPRVGYDRAIQLVSVTG